MHAGRRAEFADFCRPARIAHVMNGEAFRAVEARTADRADIGMAFVHLHQAATAPGGRWIVAEQTKISGFFGKCGGHGKTPCSIRIMPARSRSTNGVAPLTCIAATHVFV